MILLTQFAGNTVMNKTVWRENDKYWTRLLLLISDFHFCTCDTSFYSLRVILSYFIQYVQDQINYPIKAGSTSDRPYHTTILKQGLLHNFFFSMYLILYLSKPSTVDSWSTWLGSAQQKLSTFLVILSIFFILADMSLPFQNLLGLII